MNGRCTDREWDRLRSHLIPKELEKLLQIAEDDPENGLRNRTLILVMTRHALRVGETVDLRWSVDLDWEQRTLLCRRLKSGRDGLHPLAEDEYDTLRRSQSIAQTDFVFESARRQGLSKSTVQKLMKQLGQKIGVPYLCSHVLRYTACTLLMGRNVNLTKVQRYPGHANIASTTRYVGLAATQFEGIWD